jgi:hypothetical protein
MVDSSPESATTVILASIWAFFGVSGIFISLRIVARTRRGTPLWWDDFLILLSWVGSPFYGRV